MQNDTISLINKVVECFCLSLNENCDHDSLLPHSLK